jgi:predicted RNase H-like HicB family nuclease
LTESPRMSESQTVPPAPTTVAPPFTVEVRVRLRALVVPEPDGRYSVIVPALPGCVTQGDTVEDVQANVVEAAQAWLSAGFDLNRDEALKLVLE